MTVGDIIKSFDEGSDFSLEIWNLHSDAPAFCDSKDKYKGDFDHFDVESMHLTEYRKTIWLTLDIIKE